MDKKTWPTHVLPTRDLPQKDLHRMKVKGWEKNILSKWTRKKKKAGVAILISDKIDFKKRAIKRDPDGHFIILKGRIHQKDINIVYINIYIYIYSQNRSTQIQKENLGGLQERYWQQHNYSSGF